MTLEDNVKDLAMEIKKIWTEMQFQLDRIIELEKEPQNLALGDIARECGLREKEPPK